MTGCAPKWRRFLFVLFSFLLAGCSQLRRSSLDEEKEPHFIEGKRRSARADWDGAIQSYEHAVQVNPNNAAAHYELGIIYDTKKNKYAAAIYHYERFLELRTNSPMANVVQEYIKACVRELVRTVPFPVLARDVQRDLERYAQTNALYKRRIEQLEAELNMRPQYVTNYITNFVGVPQFAGKSSRSLTQPTHPLPVADQSDDISEPEPEPAAQTPAKPAPRKPTTTVVRRETTPPPSRSTTRKPSRSQPEPATSTARTTHTVRPGETLASLAARYGVSLQKLRAANPGAANGVHAGQRLVIPQ